MVSEALFEESTKTYADNKQPVCCLLQTDVYKRHDQESFCSFSLNKDGPELQDALEVWKKLSK